MKELTYEQNRVFQFISKTVKEMGIPPTIREIAEHFGYKSINNVRQHLSLIQKKGYLKIRQGKARGIELAVGMLRESITDNLIKVPLVGTVPAGKPVTALENIDDYISLDSNMFRGEGLFTLRVNGDSMEKAGILSGDIAVIKQQRTAKNNDIVVAVIEDEATLKRFYKRKNEVVLHPENPKYEDIILNGDKDISIAGKMVGLIRKW